MRFVFNPFTNTMDQIEDDHINLQNIGTYTHANIDTHIDGSGVSVHSDSFLLNIGDSGTGDYDFSDGYIDINFKSGATGANAYRSLTIHHDASNGGGLFIQKNGNNAFIGFTGWDSGTSRVLYFGGGGWGVQEPNKIQFYTTPNYADAANTAIVGMTIQSDGNVGISDNSNNAGEKLYIKNGNLWCITDTYGILFGNGKDAKIVYDGTDLWCNSALVGTGSLKIGDEGSNYTEIKSDGEINLSGTARIKKHIHLPVTKLRGSGVNTPSETVIGNFNVLQFDPTTAEFVYGTIHIPDNWDSTTDIIIHIHWAPTDGNTGNVVWDIDYKSVASEANEVISGSGTNLTVTDSTQSLQDEMLKTADMTIPAADMADLDIIGICIRREAADGADTYAADASLVLIELIFTSNKLGEAT